MASISHCIVCSIHDAADIPLRRRIEEAMGWEPRRKKVPMPEVDLFQFKRNRMLWDRNEITFCVCLTFPCGRRGYELLPDFSSINFRWVRRVERSWEFNVGPFYFGELNNEILLWWVENDFGDEDFIVLLHHEADNDEDEGRYMEYYTTSAGECIAAYQIHTSGKFAKRLPEQEI